MSIVAMTAFIAGLVNWAIWLGGVALLGLGMALAVRTVWLGYRAGAERIDTRHRPRTDDDMAAEPEPPTARGPLLPKRGGRDG